MITHDTRWAKVPEKWTKRPCRNPPFPRRSKRSFLDVCISLPILMFKCICSFLCFFTSLFLSFRKHLSLTESVEKFQTNPKIPRVAQKQTSWAPFFLKFSLSWFGSSAFLFSLLFLIVFFKFSMFFQFVFHFTTPHFNNIFIMFSFLFFHWCAPLLFRFVHFSFVFVDSVSWHFSILSLLPPPFSTDGGVKIKHVFGCFCVPFSPPVFSPFFLFLLSKVWHFFWSRLKACGMCMQCVSVHDDQPTQRLLLKANSCNVHCATHWWLKTGQRN